MYSIPKKIKSQSRPYAIVIGLDSVQGLQTARILNSRNVPVIAIAGNKNHYACLTNSCKAIIRASTLNSEFLDVLRQLGPQFEKKPVLFPCDDTAVLLLSRHRDSVSAWYHFILPEHKTIETLLDKTGFHSFCKKHDFPVPQTFFIRNEADAKRAANQLVYPVVLKPAIKKESWNQATNLKAFKVDSPEQFWSLFNAYRELADSFIAQQWIHGDDTRNHTCNFYFNRRSQPVVTLQTRKIRQWPPETGQASLGISEENPEVLDMSLKLFRTIGYHGLAYVEVKQDAKSGKYYFIEANVGRPTGRSATAEAMGLELLYTMYCDALGEPLPNKNSSSTTAVKWIHLRRDLQSSLYYMKRGRLSVAGWLRSLRGPKVYALFSLRDPLPFLGDLVRGVFLMLIPKERRKRKIVSPAPKRSGLSDPVRYQQHQDEVKHENKVLHRNTG